MITDPTKRRPGVIITRSLSDCRVGDKLIVRWKPKKMPVGVRHLPIFAPSSRLLSEAKKDPNAWSWYPDEYKDEMRALYRNNQAPFDTLIADAHERGVVLVCYCRTAEWPPDTECHRILLADALGKVDPTLRVEHR